MKRIVMMSADYVLEGPHSRLEFSFLTSPSVTHLVRKKEDVQRLLEATVPKSRLASPYQHIADLLDLHIDKFKDRYITRPRTYESLNVVSFLGAKGENLLDSEFSTIMFGKRALSALDIDVGVQFMYMERDFSVRRHTLLLHVLIAGREKKIVSKVRLPIDLPRSNLMLIMSFIR